MPSVAQASGKIAAQKECPRSLSVGREREIRFLGSGACRWAPGEALAATHKVQGQGFNQYRLLFGYGHTGKRGFSGATNFGVDQNLDVLQYSAVQLAYNWDCCGVNLEYRRFALGSVRNENQFRFTFALANVGAFGNLRRQEKLF